MGDVVGEVDAGRGVMAVEALVFQRLEPALDDDANTSPRNPDNTTRSSLSLLGHHHFLASDLKTSVADNSLTLGIFAVG